MQRNETEISLMLRLHNLFYIESTHMNIHANYIVCINGCPKVPLAIKWSSVDVALHGLKQRVEDRKTKPL